mmetsp:Transcript_55165/g.125435  ORF Transcript_55165/g.125435 Transcript_55165/m.125435 type:complete len:256 (+) Transcript_55165:1097-1864(+)
MGRAYSTMSLKGCCNKSTLRSTGWQGLGAARHDTARFFKIWTPMGTVPWISLSSCKGLKSLDLVSAPSVARKSPNTSNSRTPTKSISRTLWSFARRRVPRKPCGSTVLPRASRASETATSSTCSKTSTEKSTDWRNPGVERPIFGGSSSPWIEMAMANSISRNFLKASEAWVSSSIPKRSVRLRMFSTWMGPGEQTSRSSSRFASPKISLMPSASLEMPKRKRRRHPRSQKAALPPSRAHKQRMPAPNSTRRRCF